MPLLALTVFGPDRTGVFARVAGAMGRIGCRVQDVSATILHGHGALMVIIGAPEGTGIPEVETAARAELVGTGMSVNVQACVEGIEPPPPSPTHVLSVYGTDRPGIVHRVATVLAEHGVNLTDVDSRIVGRSDRPIYAMLIEVELAEERDVEVLRAALQVLAKELQVDISLRNVEPI